jgi:hypothetical protein
MVGPSVWQPKAVNKRQASLFRLSLPGRIQVAYSPAFLLNSLGDIYRYAAAMLFFTIESRQMPYKRLNCASYGMQHSALPRAKATAAERMR